MTGCAPALPPCPMCGKPAQAAYRPFCSKRCADDDLLRWLTGGYVIPGEPQDDDEAGAWPAEDEG